MDEIAISAQAINILTDALSSIAEARQNHSYRLAAINQSLTAQNALREYLKYSQVAENHAQTIAPLVQALKEGQKDE